MDATARVFGLNVARLRQERGWSTVDLALKAGLSVSYVYQIERGSTRRQAAGKAKESLARALGATVAVLETPHDPLAAPESRPLPRAPFPGDRGDGDPRQVLWAAVGELQKTAALISRRNGNNPAIVYDEAAREVAGLVASLLELETTGAFRQLRRPSPVSQPRPRYSRVPLRSAEDWWRIFRYRVRCSPVTPGPCMQAGPRPKASRGVPGSERAPAAAGALGEQAAVAEPAHHWPDHAVDPPGVGGGHAGRHAEVPCALQRRTGCR